jgi:hypothetical protein
MCKPQSTVFDRPQPIPAPAANDPLPTIQAPVQGSRRRRLWELDGHAHCPVLGVCLPISALRRLINKLPDGHAGADDYELHRAAVADCKHRSRLAEAVQRELDRRYVQALRQASQAKSTEALATWWAHAPRCQEIAGALWATLTHPRCTPELANQVQGEVHMLQHQAGMAARVDLARFEALLEENAVLTRELAAAQQRSTLQAGESARRIDLLQSEMMKFRAQLISRNSSIAALTEDLQTLEAASPGLRSRLELARECESQFERNYELQRQLLQSQQECERQQRRVNWRPNRSAAMHRRLEARPAGAHACGDRAKCIVSLISFQPPAMRVRTFWPAAARAFW